MRSAFYLCLLGAALLTLALVVRSGLLARKNNEEPMSAAMRAAMNETSPQLSGEDAAVIRQQYPTAYSTPTGLLYINRAPGTGPSPRVGDTVTARYSGRLLDGTPFDSSSYRGGDFKFELGTGKVIKGFDEAFLSMKRGSRRTLIIPYWLGYGVAGRPPLIPPKATLVFDVELVDFR